jgi:hypothetical protein
MKKKLVIVGLITLLVCVGLSGCNQQTSNSNTSMPSSNSNTNTPSSDGNSDNPYSNLVEVSNVKVTTKWNDGYYNGQHGQTDGFYHDYPTYQWGGATFEVSGVVKNIATSPIDSVNIKVNFLDDKGNNLQSSSTTVYNLYLGDSQSFTVSIGSGSTYFDHISDYRLQITNVQLH